MAAYLTHRLLWHIPTLSEIQHVMNINATVFIADLARGISYTNSPPVGSKIFLISLIFSSFSPSPRLLKMMEYSVKECECEEMISIACYS